MNIIKREKGITIVSLIITVVILMILAVVAISAIEDNDIIEFSNNAVDKYQQKKDEEDDIITDYEDILQEYDQK